MRILTASDVERLLPMPVAIELMRVAMRQVSAGETLLPLRHFAAIPGTAGKMVVMPGYIADPPSFGVKFVSKFPRARGDRHGTHVGAVLICGADDGVPLALMDGATLTAIRTAAASAMATDVLARSQAKSLLIVGSGEQARRHVKALRYVRDFKRVTIWSRTRVNAEALAAEVGAEVPEHLYEGVSSADVICTTTSSTTPILHGVALSPGCHVNLVGAPTATSAEADSEVVRRSRYFVDYRAAALAAAGELIDSGLGQRAIAGEIGEVLLGRVAGREDDTQITVYKSLGVIAQDLVAAHAVWRAADAQGVGLVVDLSA